MGWLRARKPEQKEERRSRILAAAAQLLEEKGFDSTSLSAIACRARSSKANIYRYFESREEIFLHLLLEDLEDWVADLERALAPLAGSGNIEAVAREMTRAYLQSPRLAALVSVTTAVLERNITLEAVVRFKTRALELVLRLGNAVHAAIPELDIEKTRQFLKLFHSLVAGMWPAANPAPVVRQALSRPELSAAGVEIERDLPVALVALLRGFVVSGT